VNAVALFTCVVMILSASTESFASPNPEPSLSEAFASDFAIGFGTGVVSGASEELVRRHSSTVTCENSLKPAPLHPDRDTWDWKNADAWVAWATSLGKEPIGHTLVWCYMQPKWMMDLVEKKGINPADALAWQDDHIRTLVGRYRGQIKTWDVVNEALADNAGASDLRDDPWSNLCGEDYIIQAFRSARAAAPAARLLYNDYNLEQPDKRARLFRLLKHLKAAGLNPDGIGIQGHWTLDSPSIGDIEAAIMEIYAAGYRVHITELDVSVYQWKPGANLQRRDFTPASDVAYPELPEEIQNRLADRYGDIFGLFLKHRDKIERVTFWNVDDGLSWLNNWPLRGRPNHPLLFDRQQRPKPAFHAVISELYKEAAK
jgi:endo-1,4-beta-xylanase